MVNWPEYVCAILETFDGRFLLESRPGNARLAAGQLTCFGGRREADERPEQCLCRELREELNWEPQKIKKQVELWVGEKLVAWFYHAELDADVDQLQLLPNHQAILVSREELPDLPVSLWHAAIFEAWFAGRHVVKLDL